MAIKTIYYWSIQVVVWTLLSSVLLISYWIGGNQLNLELWQLFMDMCVLIILSVVATHLLRRFLNKYIEFDNLKLIDGFNVLWLLALFTTLFYLSYISYNYVAYSFIYDKAEIFSHDSQSFKNNLLVYINYAVYFLIWTVFYVAIKGLIQLNRGREARLKLEANLKESQLNTLKGQINPHFMFNSLNNIRGLMLEDVDRARDMLTHLSETLRYSLTKSEVNSISLEDELEMVEGYVEISKIQFEDRLEFVTAIDPDSLHKQIPPMIIQMLVENALKHGISQLKSGGKISLSTQVNSKHLEIEVVNSGVLQQVENTTQLGLKNIQTRLQLLYGKDAFFTISEMDNQVFANIKIPLI